VRNLEFSKGYKFVKEIVKQAKKRLSLEAGEEEAKLTTGK
jgi:hypothetical protein